MQQTQRGGRGGRAAPAEPKTTSTSRSPSPPLRRGNGGRPRRRGAGALWGALLLAGAYYLLVRRPPSAARQAVLGGLRGASRESLLAASEMTRQVEAAQLQKHAPGDVAAAFVAVLADDGCLPRTHPAASGGGGGDAGEQLRLEAKKLVAGLRAAAPTLPCAWDASLPADPGKYGRLLVAANLRDSEALMPHLILQLVAVLAHCPPRTVLLSVYESGSRDATGVWLGVLRLLAAALPQAAVITAGGDLRRAPGEDRIAFLASVRNAALAPLWQAEPWPAERVVFLNDVFACAGDVARLLAHETAHLACGLDFDRPRIAQMDRQTQRRLFAEWLARRARVPRSLGRAAARWTLLLRRWRDAAATEAAFQATAPLQLYDTWVTRDAAGRRATKLPPYLQDPAGAARLAAGLPAPVACCWNGLAVLDAAPLREGLRMRAHQPGECAASECSLLCADYTRLGRHRFVLDPGVRLAYTLREAQAVRTAAPGGPAFVAANGTTWADVVAAPAIDWEAYHPPQQVDCCSLGVGKDSIVFADDCSPRDVLMPNHTAAVLAAAAGAA